MAEGDDPSAPATMADIKAIEKSLGSAIDAKFLELQNLILQLKEARVTPPNPPLEDPLASNEGDSEEAQEKRKRGEEEKLKSEAALKGSTSTSPADKPKEDYHAVDLQYTLDTPVPHHRITPLGSPPPLDASAFTSWQHSMKSYFNIASIELWRIIQVGFNPVDPGNLTRREVSESQLNDVATHMIEQAVGKEKHQIEHCITAKEA